MASRRPTDLSRFSIADAARARVATYLYRVYASDNGLLGNPDDPQSQFYNPVFIQDEFDEETSSAFEIGVKSELMDGRLSLEGAYYYTKVDDMQFFEFLVGPFGLLRTVSNIDEVEIQGFEVGANWAATDWFSLSAGFNYTDSEIQDNSSRPQQAVRRPGWQQVSL